jgi:hypothetical protein
MFGSEEVTLRAARVRTLATTVAVALACWAGVALLAGAPALAAGKRHGKQHRSHAHARSETGRAFVPSGTVTGGPSADAVGAEVAEPCDGERVPPFSACVVPYAVSAAENHLLAGYGEAGEATSATVCVYLSTLQRNSFAWDGSPVSCNDQPVIYTLGYAGHPTIYNDTGHWITAGFADLH